MLKKTLVAALLLAVPGGSAWAANEPDAFGETRSGNLRLVSGVVVEPKSVELKGGWLNEKTRCTATRRLRVSTEIFYTAKDGSTTRVRKWGTFPRTPNCAEGGPNRGFKIRAKRYKLACPNGSWKPGTYSFVTTTELVGGGLTASASLVWSKTGAC